MSRDTPLPVAVIGAGPVGLAAAAHLLDRGLTPVIFERGSGIASNIRDWAHVPLFTPWGSLVDLAAQKLLEGHGWVPPEWEDLPTGALLIERYLEPLAAVPETASNLRLDTEVTGISRRNADKVQTARRVGQPFVLHLRDRKGVECHFEASAVIDASGTWATANPIGADGLPAPGEIGLRDRIWYGIPDPIARHRERYAGKRVLIVGSGYSAANVVLDLIELKRSVPDTEIVWAIRGKNLAQLTQDDGEGPPSRIALGRAVQTAQSQGAIELVTEFRVRELRLERGRIQAVGCETENQTRIEAIDEIVCTTGQRPDLAILRELRVQVDPVLECVPALSELIDPNLHSCYSVPPHGWKQLCHPSEPGFFIVGMKSYGGRVLASHLRAQSLGALHRPDGLSRHSSTRS